jgi:hypothetical protein
VSVAAARHLHVVDATSGEVLEGCPACAVKEDEIKGLERDIRGWAARYAELKRDREREAREHDAWPIGMRLFRVYCQLTPRQDGQPRRLSFDAARFECWLQHFHKWGEEMCLRAIVGRVFDHHTAQRKNGTTIHYFEWERIFGNAGKMTPTENFEESCRRAPADWRERLPVQVRAAA